MWVNMDKVISYIVIVVFLMGCYPELDFTPENYKSQVVVDGRIENGRLARVFLTRSAAYTGTNDSISLLEQIITKAKVEISDGEQSEVLTLKRDDNLFPPFYYKGNRMIGEIGKSYTLTIIDRGDTIRSSTSIPEPPILTQQWLEPNVDNDTLATLNIELNDEIGTKDYYRFYTRSLSGGGDYQSAWLANYSDDYFNGDLIQLALLRGKENPLSPSNEFFFHIDDMALIKACKMDKASFDFWTSFDNEVSNGRNPFASSNKQVHHNIIGGIGIWCGFGVNEYYTEGK